MARARKAEKIKAPLIFFFIILLAFNGVLTLLEPYSLYRSGQPLIFPGPADTPFGTLMVIFLLGVGISWWFARVVYRFLFSREVEVEDALNVSYTLSFYLLLAIVAYPFLGISALYLFPLLFVVLLVVSLLTLWNFLGGPAMAGSVILAAVIVLAVWFWPRTENGETFPSSQAESTQPGVPPLSQ